MKCQFIFPHNFQSTPPSKGRHIGARIVMVDDISIHAPAQGATRSGRRADRLRYFNPRPRARGDMLLALFISSVFHFNPRPRARGDGCFFRYLLHFRISIHAPAQGATTSLARRRLHPNFNPRPRARGDRFMRDCIAWHEISIHAPAQGATYLFAATTAGFNLNPRPRARGDWPSLEPTQ